MGSVLDLRVELKREEDGRWFGVVPELRGVMAYGDTEVEAVTNTKAAALRVLADLVEWGEVQLEDPIRFVA